MKRLSIYAYDHKVTRRTWSLCHYRWSTLRLLSRHTASILTTMSEELATASRPFGLCVYFTPGVSCRPPCWWRFQRRSSSLFPRLLQNTVVERSWTKRYLINSTQGLANYISTRSYISTVVGNTPCEMCKLQIPCTGAHVSESWNNRGWRRCHSDHTV